MHYVSTSSKVPGGPGKLNFYLVKSIIVGALGGLLFGFDTAVIAGTTQQLTTVFHLSPTELGWTVSIALVGTIIGAMSSGVLGDHLGGRESLRILALFYVISALGCAFAWNWPSLLIFRFIGGLGIGGSSVLGPVYIAEIAPAKWRGLLVGSFQINIVIGILVAYLSNFLLGPCQLRHERMALAVGCSGASRAAVPHHAVRYPSQRTLAGDQEPHPRSTRSNRPPRLARRRQRTRRHHRLDSCRRPGTLRATVSAQVSPAHLSRIHRCGVQSARRHQCHPLLLELHLRHGRLRQGVRRLAGCGRWGNEPACDACWACRSSTSSAAKRY